MGTYVARTTNVEEIWKLGLAYDMPSYPVDGMDPVAVHEGVLKAVERARKGEGPSFLEINTYRYKGHSMSDPGNYRSKEEVEEYKKIDPIETTRATIIKKKYATAKALEKIDMAVKEEIDACVQFAEESPFPDASELYADIYVQQDYPFLTDY